MCRKVLAGQSPETIARYLAATGGAAACTAYGAGAVAPLCGQAAATIASWFFGGYTPAERAHHVLGMARQRRAYLVCFYANLSCRPGSGADLKYADAIRDNVNKIGLYKLWELPDQAAAEKALLLVMTARGIADKPISWWLAKQFP